MDKSMTGKVVVVTGASAGIGRAIALEFAREGARVAVLARGQGRLDTLCDQIRANGGTAHPIVADVADAEAVEAAADEAERVLGPIDVWVNNAMVTVFGPVDGLAPAEIRRVTEVTYLGTVHGTLSALRRMRGRGRGNIIQVGSALAYRSIPLQSAYCGAKAAVRGFTDALRSELIHEDSAIRVSMLQLGAFNTPQFDWARNHLGKRPKPVGTVFQPEIAARAAVRAAREGPRELWVGFGAAKAILGQRIAPALGDSQAARQAWDQQHTDEPDPASRADNLFETVDWDEGTHGRFDDAAKRRSPQQWASRHGGLLAVGVAAAAGVALAMAQGNRRPDANRT